LILAIGLRGPLGRGPALLAAASFGTCVLILYYGRLAYPETLQMLEMTAGMVLVGKARKGTSGRWGLLAGILFGLAIATKANALFGLVGGIAAFAIVEGTAGAVRRWLVAALIGLTIVASVWLVAVFIPFQGAVMTDISIWPHQVAPDSVGELFRRIAGYAFRSDGGLPGLAPIAVAAGIGVVATAAGRRTLSPAARALAVAAMGWIAIQLVVLVVASYRPNRYLLPLLPAAAILVGVGASVIHQHLGRRAGGRRPVTRALAAFAIAALVLPGLISYAGWMSRATYVLGPTQEAAARLLPRGATVWGGFAPLVAMKAEVTTIVPWPAAPANVGPSYQSRPIRWVVAGNHDPAWIVPHSAAWASRQERICLPWDGVQICLYELLVTP
jgi:4-amino-4-deoxy-L-arabinose transferase-like glycosyltransferase